MIGRGKQPSLLSSQKGKKLDAFLKLFGDMTVATVVLIIATLIFLWKVYKVIEKHFKEKYVAEAKKEKQFSDILSQVQQYPKWRQQSIDIQNKFATSISDLQKSQEEITEELRIIEERRKKTERNNLRDRLLQSFRYYTSQEKNPMAAWSEMEAEAFWKIFKDYEDLDGNGHIHTVVQPAMRLLTVVYMDEEEKVAELMHSRK